MFSIEFLSSVGADHQERHFRNAIKEIRNDLQAGGIAPMQVVYEYDQWFLGSCIVKQFLKRIDQVLFTRWLFRCRNFRYNQIQVANQWQLL